MSEPPCVEFDQRVTKEAALNRGAALWRHLKTLRHGGETLLRYMEEVDHILDHVYTAKYLYESVPGVREMMDENRRYTLDLRGVNSTTFLFMEHVRLSYISWCGRVSTMQQCRNEIKKLQIRACNELRRMYKTETAEIVKKELQALVNEGFHDVEVLIKRVKRRTIWLKDQFYYSVVYQFIWEMGHCVLRDPVRLFVEGGGHRRQSPGSPPIIFDNGREVTRTDIAAVYGHWFAGTNNVPYLTDGVIARPVLGRARTANGDVPVLGTPEPCWQHPDAVHVPYVPFRERRYRKHIGIEALRLLYKWSKYGGVPDLQWAGGDREEANRIVSQLDNDEAASMTARMIIIESLSSYQREVNRIWPGATNRSNLLPSLARLQQYGPLALDDLVQRWAQINLDLLGYEGIRLVYDVRKPTNKSVSKWFVEILKHTPRSVSEIGTTWGLSVRIARDSRRYICHHRDQVIRVAKDVGIGVDDRDIDILSDLMKAIIVHDSERYLRLGKPGDMVRRWELSNHTIGNGILYRHIEMVPERRPGEDKVEVQDEENRVRVVGQQENTKDVDAFLGSLRSLEKDFDDERTGDHLCARQSPGKNCS